MNKIKEILNKSLRYLKDDRVEIRIRMLYLLEFAIIIACFIGTAAMIIMRQPFAAIAPNILLLALGIIGLGCTLQEKYDLAAIFLIIGCADITLPIMFFAAGGNNSGMPMWFVFGVLVACMMAKGKVRIFMVALTLTEDIACMLLGHFRPELVTPMVGESAGFFDMVQSFTTVCVGLCIVFVVHILTYERQRRLLEYQSREMERIMQMDSLTGVYNRRAYYDAIQPYQTAASDSLVVVAMDVNGLKAVNDTLGHAEGDAMLAAAAKVIGQAFGQYGQVYRTGGDEFVALLSCTPEDYEGLHRRLDACRELTRAPDGRKLAIAMGAVSWRDNPGMSFQELVMLADKKMYEDKKSFYASAGVCGR